MKIFSISKIGTFSKFHPQEDFFLISKKYPIFIVADGVSLNIKKGNKYPKQSGALEVAKIFCQSVMLEAEKRYENFCKKDLKEIFKIGNRAILKYNVSQNRIGPESGRPTINYYDIDLFSATASFLLIKDKKAFWFSLCDSAVRVFDETGKKLFASPDGWRYFPKKWVEWTNGKHDKEKIIIRHRNYRNAVNKNGEPAGYGVIDGESLAESYLESGVLDINRDDLAFVFTDGFENYFSSKKLVNLFKIWPKNLEKQLESLISEKSKSDPQKFGREKTLIAISI